MASYDERDPVMRLYVVARAIEHYAVNGGHVCQWRAADDGAGGEVCTACGATK